MFRLFYPEGKSYDEIADELGRSRETVRKQKQYARLRLGILFFLGYDLDEPLPWHSTISRTRALFGEDVFKALFKQVLGLCVHKGMLSGKRQAIDSAFIKANASIDSLVEKEIIEDGEHYLTELQHDEYGAPIGQHENVMKDDRDSNTITKSRNKSTQEHHNWKGEEYKDMPKGKSTKKAEGTGDDAVRPKFVSNHTHYSTTDYEAQLHEHKTSITNLIVLTLAKERWANITNARYAETAVSPQIRT